MVFRQIVTNYLILLLLNTNTDLKLVEIMTFIASIFVIKNLFIINSQIIMITITFMANINHNLTEE